MDVKLISTFSYSSTSFQESKDQSIVRSITYEKTNENFKILENLYKSLNRTFHYKTTSDDNIVVVNLSLKHFEGKCLTIYVNNRQIIKIVNIIKF